MTNKMNGTASQTHRRSPAGIAALVLVLVPLWSSGCDKKTHALPWGDKQLTQLAFGAYKITIPDGWRALSELHDASVALPSGLVGMTPERLEDGAMRSNMVFTWAAAPPNVPIPTCDEYGKLLASSQHASLHDTATLAVGGDVACRWHLTSSDASVTEIVRFQGDHQLVVQWTRMASLGSGDAGGDSKVWNQVLAQLHIPAA